MSADFGRDAPAEHLRAILEGLTVAVCSRDRERRVVYLNPRAEQLTGYRMADLAGVPCRDLFCHRTPTGETLCGEDCPAEGSLREGTASPPLALEVRTVGGDRLAVMTRFAPVRSLDGEVVGFVETFETAEPVPTGWRLPTVLLADADPAVRSLLSAQLKASRCRVLVAADAGHALSLARERPDLVLLDPSLPGSDGLEVLERLRGSLRGPIVVLAGRAAEKDRLSCFDRGADDFILKPFSPAELAARVRTALRRALPAAAAGPEQVVAGELRIDFAKRAVTVAGRLARLTRTEYELLACLARQPGVAISQADLLCQVWGPECEGQNEYLHTFVAQLRRKIEPDPRHPRYVLTEPRFGYRLYAADRR